VIGWVVGVRKRHWRLDGCVWEIPSTSVVRKLEVGGIGVMLFFLQIPPQLPRMAHLAQSIGPRLQFRQSVPRLQLMAGRSICDS
jgi:hypothetical protein